MMPGERCNTFDAILLTYYISENIGNYFYHWVLLFINLVKLSNKLYLFTFTSNDALPAMYYVHNVS